MDWREIEKLPKAVGVMMVEGGFGWPKKGKWENGMVKIEPNRMGGLMMELTWWKLDHRVTVQAGLGSGKLRIGLSGKDGVSGWMEYEDNGKRLEQAQLLFEMGEVGLVTAEYKEGEVVIDLEGEIGIEAVPNEEEVWLITKSEDERCEFRLKQNAGSVYRMLSGGVNRDFVRLVSLVLDLLPEKQE